jgi:coproporphyrinogen III oxidase-like Fe-S oxidoreductase
MKNPIHTVETSSTLNAEQQMNRFLQKTTTDRTIEYQTVYFGGGTPSLARPETLHSVISTIRNCSSNKNVKELY